MHEGSVRRPCECRPARRVADILAIGTVGPRNEDLLVTAGDSSDPSDTRSIGGPRGFHDGVFGQVSIGTGARGAEVKNAYSAACDGRRRRSAIGVDERNFRQATTPFPRFLSAHHEGTVSRDRR